MTIWVTMTVWKVSLIMMNLDRITTWVFSSPQLFTELQWLSAHCLPVQAPTHGSFSLHPKLHFWPQRVNLRNNTCSAANNRQKLENAACPLASKVPDLFLRGWWRPKTELKRGSEMNQISRNQMKCNVSSYVSCVNKQRLMVRPNTKQAGCVNSQCWHHPASAHV